MYILKTLSFRVGGGQDKLAWTAYPPGVKIIRVGGKISREILPPGGQAVQGGKINCYTGTKFFPSWLKKFPIDLEHSQLAEKSQSRR